LRQQLRQVINYVEGTDCRRTIQLGYFGERFAGNCGNCDNCLSNPVEDWTIEAMKFLSCGALQRTIWDESHYRRAAWLEKSENPSVRAS